MPKLSIIVPVYNVEQYLGESLDSILAQTFTDFELILVNDGSTDKSGEICDQYAEMDQRITVIHQKNRGVSAARNTGLRFTNADYIGFVDPDDRISPNMYALLLDKLTQHDAEVVICRYRIISERDNTIVIPGILEPADRVIDQKTIGKEMMPSILVNNTLSLDPCVNKVYKKKLLDRHQLIFDEQRDYGEDARFNFTLLTLVDRLVYVDQPLYHYIRRYRNSLTQVFRENFYVYLRNEKNFYIWLCKKYDLKQYEKVIRMLFTTKSLLFAQEIVSQKDISVQRKNELLATIIGDAEFQMDIGEYKTKNAYYKLLRYLCIWKKEKYLTKVIQLKHKIRSPL